jgi:hypothetical protein
MFRCKRCGPVWLVEHTLWQPMNVQALPICLLNGSSVSTSRLSCIRPVRQKQQHVEVMALIRQCRPASEVQAS